MAIIYSYPEKTTPAGGDFLVITDSEQPAPKKNRTKSLTIDNLASYITTSTSIITGSGTLRQIPMFTPNGQAIGDSVMFQIPNNPWIQVGVVGVGQETILGPGFVSTTALGVDNIVAIDGGSVTLNGNVIIGNADTDLLTVTSTSRFYNNVQLGAADDDEIVVKGTLELQGPVKDYAATLGTAGKILISDSSGQLSFGDQIDTTYTHSSAQAGSDAVIRLTDGVTNQDVTLVAGNSISLTDDGSNNITIAATGGAANTEYDLASSQNGSNVDVTLTGTDATTDTVSLIAGTNVTLTDDGSNNITIDSSPAVTYDLVGTYNASDTILTLQGSDATSDTFTLHAGSGISFGQDAVNGITTISLDITDNVTGSGTLNTIPMWTPDGQTLGDSFITLDTTGSPFINVSVPLTAGSLNVTNIFGADGGFVTLSGNVVVGNASTDIFSINGTATFNADVTLGNTSAQNLTVNAVTVFNSSARFASQLVDTAGASGLSGMVLTSTGTGVDWVNVSDLTDNVTGSGTAGKLPYWNPDGATLADSLITQTSDNSITIGVGATATGSEAISLSRSEARADYSFAHGYESITDGEFSVTLGKGGYTAGDHSAAIGYKGISLGRSAISGGHSSSAGGDGAIALGHNASAGNYGVAKATNTFPNDQTTFDIYGIVGTVAVGTFLRYGPGFDVADPRIEVTQFTDLGNGAATITIASGIRPIAGELLVFEEQTPQRNDHQGGVALGNDAFSLGQGAVALGQDAVADADFAVAIGRTASTSTQDSIALGGGSTKILIEALVNANSYADDTAAAAGGVAIGELYRNGNVVQIRLT